MTNLETRVAQLEARMGVAPAAYPNIMFTNVNFHHPDESPPEEVVVPGVYLLTFGRRLTPEELEAVRVEYKREHGIE